MKDSILSFIEWFLKVAVVIFVIYALTKSYDSSKEKQYKSAYSEGYEWGYDEGYSNGYYEGYIDGYDVGYSDSEDGYPYDNEVFR